MKPEAEAGDPAAQAHHQVGRALHGDPLGGGDGLGEQARPADQAEAPPDADEGNIEGKSRCSTSPDRAAVIEAVASTSPLTRDGGQLAVPVGEASDQRAEGEHAGDVGGHHEGAEGPRGRAASCGPASWP